MTKDKSKSLANVDEGSMNYIIQSAISNKDVDPAKLNQLLDFQERVMTKQAEIAFNQAMAEMHPKMPNIKKMSKGHNSKYAKYEHIERKVRPIYTHHGFSIRYNSEITTAGEVYTGTLMHKDGHSVTASMTLPPDVSGSKNAIQAKGSTVSYARRYLLTMLLNIITEDEDDDGQSAGGVISEKHAEILKKLILETESDVTAFLDMFGAKSVDSLAANSFYKAHSLLMTKKEVMKNDSGK